LKSGHFRESHRLILSTSSVTGDTSGSAYLNEVPVPLDLHDLAKSNYFFNTNQFKRKGKQCQGKIKKLKNQNKGWSDDSNDWDTLD